MVFAIINGMTIRVDKAGRVVLPKPVRDRFHLREGAELELLASPRGLALRPVARQPSLVRKGGLLVHRGKAPRGFDWDRLVDEFRDERIQDAADL